MTLHISDAAPISEAPAEEIQLAEDVAGANSEAGLMVEQANLSLAEEAINGLKQALASQFISDKELEKALTIEPGR